MSCALRFPKDPGSGWVSDPDSPQIPPALTLTAQPLSPPAASEHEALLMAPLHPQLCP